MRARRAVLVLALTLGAIAPLAAQDSEFSLHGLGLVGRPMSARAAGSAGALALFDAATPLNPAALGRWQTMVGWVVGAPSHGSFGGGGQSGTLDATRFPLIGFATRPGERLAIGLTISDYLDRSWGVSQVDTTVLRGDSTEFTDVSKSLGGVSDLQAAGAYQVSSRLTLGLGLHVLTGSARATVQREYTDTSYTNYGDSALTDFSGAGLSLGATMQITRTLAMSGMLRVNSSLTAKKISTGERAAVHLPEEAGLGLLYQPAPGVTFAASAQYAGWARASDDLVAAGQEGARNVWSYSVGGELAAFRRGSGRTPLRFGYRSRQLPFLVGGALVGEHAFSLGTALVFASARTTLDLGVERGSRSVGSLAEHFTNGYVGLTIAP